MGRHEGGGAEPGSSSANACSCLASMAPTSGDSSGEYANIVCSASWNRQFCLWDLRTSSSSSKPIASLELPGKAFSMDVDAEHNRLVVATAGRRNVVIDLKKTSNITPEMVLDRESSLKFQTRTIRFFPDGRGVALGSVEGRVGVEYFDELLPNNNDNKRYAFKCHRVNDTVYPVNCIAFHPRFTNTFATGGCDGSVVLWDGGNKKKVSWMIWWVGGWMNDTPTRMAVPGLDSVCSHYTHSLHCGGTLLFALQNSHS